MSVHECGAHVGEDEQGSYSDEEELSTNDTTIRNFVREHGAGKRKRLFIAVTADYCGPCKKMKAPENLNWHTAKNRGTTFFTADDAAALCCTVGKADGGFPSALLFKQGRIEVKYYPTLLEYSPSDMTWKNVDRSVLLSKQWLTKQ